MTEQDPERLLERIRELEDRLEESEATLSAIRNGEVDAVVVSGAEGPQVYTLRGADELYRILVQDMMEGVVTIHPEGLILFSNQQFADMIQAPVEQVTGSRIQDFIAPGDEEIFAALLESGLKAGAKNELRLKRRDGSAVPAFLSISHLGVYGVECACVIAADLSEQKRNQEIVAAEKLTRSIFEQSAEAIVVADPDGVIIRASRTAQGLSGGQVLDRHFDDVFHGNHPFEEIVSGDLRGESSEVTATMPDGRLGEFLFRAAPLRGRDAELLGYIINLTNITGRKRMEEQLRQSQKLETVGVLAGGIAHDFNNILTGVLGNTYLALEDLPADHPVTAWLQSAVEGANRAADLTSQLLAYAGKGRYFLEPVALPKLIGNIKALIESSVPKHVELDLDIPWDLPAIEADAGQMQQLLMNLVINAAEAIDQPRGRVLVRAGIRQLDSSYIHKELPSYQVAPGAYVSVEVTDDGCGMDEQTLARVFDPFFTTKFTGRGLGLAAVQGIVRGHKGALKVSSAPGKGTTFLVLLPAAGAPAEPQPAREVQAIRGTGTVLVVDDEEIVRSVAKALLERLGYQVLLAENGMQALEVFQEHAGEISIVLLDLTMPVMSGEETFPRLKEICSQVKIFLTSGFSEKDVLRRFEGQGISGFVQKPFTRTSLSSALQSGD
jgi:PAS domain S-box-containing protein